MIFNKYSSQKDCPTSNKVNSEKKKKSKRKNGDGQNFIHDLQFLQYLNAKMALVNNG
jgi:hypothetical protein